VAPDFVQLVAPLPPPALPDASSPTPPQLEPPLPPPPSPLQPSSFLVIVNYSAQTSHGHVLLSRADESAYATAAGAGAAARIADIARDAGAHLVAFVDRLGGAAPLSAPAAALAGEGLWLTLAPWEARILEIVPLAPPML
jgi:hypothetical protein